MGRGHLVLLGVLLGLVIGTTGCNRNQSQTAVQPPEQDKVPGPEAPKSTQSQAYLAQLQETDVSALSFQKKPGQDWAGVVVNGESSPNGLLIHPSSNGAASATYKLGGRYQTFDSTVAVNDGANGGAGSVTALVFVVKGDGRELWRSKPVQECKKPQSCSVSVAGVDQLTLVVECPGDAACAHAVWAEPLVK